MGKILAVTAIIYALCFVISFLVAGLIALIHHLLAKFETSQGENS
jgi:hypothetical protein